jgi:anti-sigma28 factor (negative regulator of flagellin synthesis)
MDDEMRLIKRHRPGEPPKETELSKLRERVESGAYVVKPQDVADAMLRRGTLGGFSLPRSLRQG